MPDVRRSLMPHLLDAVAAEYPGDYVRQAGVLQHLESLIRDLDCLPERQLRAIVAGLTEAAGAPL